MNREMKSFPQLVSGIAGVWTKADVVTFLFQRLWKLQKILTNSFNWQFLQVQTWSTIFTTNYISKVALISSKCLSPMINHPKNGFSIWMLLLGHTSPWVSHAHTCLAVYPKNSSPWSPWMLFTWAISQGFVCIENNLEGLDTTYPKKGEGAVLILLLL